MRVIWLRYLFVGSILGVAPGVCDLSLGAASTPLEVARFVALCQGGEVYVATGVSMEPVWEAGDLLVVTRKAEGGRLKDEFRAGMDVVYVAPDGVVTAHRVVRARGPWLVTQGVNNPVVDPYFVHREQVLGVVVAVFRASDAGRGARDK